jgi:hypothetical protein
MPGDATEVRRVGLCVAADDHGVIVLRAAGQGLNREDEADEPLAAFRHRELVLALGRVDHPRQGHPVDTAAAVREIEGRADPARWLQLPGGRWYPRGTA